jgi:hypothetical protein
MKPSALRIERMLEKIEAAVNALPSQRKRVLKAIVDDTDAEAVVKEKQEKVLAEHIARHPEDVGRTIADFDWILNVIMRQWELQKDRCAHCNRDGAFGQVAQALPGRESLIWLHRECEGAWLEATTAARAPDP